MQVFGLVLTLSAVMYISIGRKTDTTWEAVPLISVILADVCSYPVKKLKRHLEKGESVVWSKSLEVLDPYEAIVMAEQELTTSRYIAECSRSPGMKAIHNKRIAWLSVIVRLAKTAVKGERREGE